MQQQSNTLYKEIHVLGVNTTMEKYEHARQFSVLPCHSISHVLLHLLLLFVFTLRSCPPQLLTLCLRSSVRSSRRSLCLRSPNSLFPLLVFVFVSQSHGSRSYCLSCFLPTLFNRPLVLFRCRYSLSSSFSLHTCTCVGQVRGQRLAWVK